MDGSFCEILSRVLGVNRFCKKNHHRLGLIIDYGVNALLSYLIISIILTYSSPITLSLPPENIRKP